MVRTIALGFLEKYKSYAYLSFLIAVLFVFKLVCDREAEHLSHQIVYSDEYTIKEGDSLLKILEPYKFSARDAQQLLESAKSTVDLTKLKVGQNIQIKYANQDSNKSLEGLTVHFDNTRRVEISKDQGLYKANNIVVNFNKDIYRVSGEIRGNITSSVLKAGVPLRNLVELTGIYSHQIDFQRDIRDGDKFTIVLEKFTSEDKKSTYFGKTIFSCLEVNGQKYNIYRFKLSDGTEDFFDEKYQSVRRSLLKTPVMASRITSKFGPRKHPVLGYTLMHQGVDFAAPIGTPIYAAGSGIVTEVGHKGSYGRYVKIRHTGDISTAYAHVKSFAQGIAHGVKVKQGQVIAFVGNSGSCTGPHLHYEVLSNGVRINPLKFKTIPTRKLAGSDHISFVKYKESVDWSVTHSPSPDLTASLKHHIS